MKGTLRLTLPHICAVVIVMCARPSHAQQISDYELLATPLEDNFQRQRVILYPQLTSEDHRSYRSTNVPGRKVAMKHFCEGARTVS